MRITRFAASLSLALAAAPLIAATPLPSGHPPVALTASVAATPASAVSPSLYRYLVGNGALRPTAKRFALSVYVGGSYNVPVNSYGYLYTGVSGGTAPYTYCWYRNDLWTSCGSYSGQNPYFWATGTEYFRVEVTDANGQFASSSNFFVHIY